MVANRHGADILDEILGTGPMDKVAFYGGVLVLVVGLLVWVLRLDPNSAASSVRRKASAVPSYRSSDSGGVSSGRSGPSPSSRTSVSSNSVMVISPGTGSSITSAMMVSTAGGIAGFVGLTFFRATFFAPARLGLSFAKRFFGIALATVRFADLPREDFDALRTLPRAVDLPFLTVARFFR